MKLKEKKFLGVKRILAMTVAGTLAVAGMGFTLAPIQAEAAKTTVSTTVATKIMTDVTSYPVTVNSATIAGTNVVVSVKASSIPSSDDGLYHLIAEETYATGATGTEVAKVTAGAVAQFVFPLNKNTANSNLYKKFVVCVKKGGVLTPVSGAKYITNPEATATNSVARMNVGKKGILPSAAMIDSNDLVNLGIQQCTYNVPVGNLCSSSGGTIPYTYNGKTYNFSAAIVGQYDKLVPLLNSRGIQISLVILNNKTSDNTLIHPLSRGYSGANYYAFNAAEQAGVEKLAAVATFLAQRYSGTGHGQVDNWIIGNEINARADWNYMSAVDVNTYTYEYDKAFRVFYTGIKSVNANANVYMSCDQQWAKSANAKRYYSSVDFLNAFNTLVAAEGNIDWHVAVHPYNVPLYDPYAWNGSSKYIQHSVTTPYISMQNIDVLTDYLGQAAFLSPTGQVRSVICSEQGYTSSKAGETVQAAAVVYGYLQAMANQHIDGFILAREQDDAGEIAQGLANGLVSLNGSHKLAYEYYKNINGANGATYAAQAAQIIGVADIASLLTVR